MRTSLSWVWGLDQQDLGRGLNEDGGKSGKQICGGRLWEGAVGIKGLGVSVEWLPSSGLGSRISTEIAVSRMLGPSSSMSRCIPC